MTLERSIQSNLVSYERCVELVIRIHSHCRSDGAAPTSFLLLAPRSDHGIATAHECLTSPWRANTQYPPVSPAVSLDASKKRRLTHRRGTVFLSRVSIGSGKVPAGNFARCSRAHTDILLCTVCRRVLAAFCGVCSHFVGFPRSAARSRERCSRSPGVSLDTRSLRLQAR